MDSKTATAVIGTGIVPYALALMLSDHGYSVDIYEQGQDQNTNGILALQKPLLLTLLTLAGTDIVVLESLLSLSGTTVSQIQDGQSTILSKDTTDLQALDAAHLLSVLEARIQVTETIKVVKNDETERISFKGKFFQQLKVTSLIDGTIGTKDSSKTFQFIYAVDGIFSKTRSMMISSLVEEQNYDWTYSQKSSGNAHIDVSFTSETLSRESRHLIKSGDWLLEANPSNKRPYLFEGTVIVPKAQVS